MILIQIHKSKRCNKTNLFNIYLYIIILYVTFLKSVKRRGVFNKEEGLCGVFNIKVV